MPWRIKLKAGTAKTINKLDKPVRERIKSFLDTLASEDNPRITGKALQGQLSGYWRYRIDDYRLICQIQDNELVVLVIELVIGNISINSFKRSFQYCVAIATAF